jgi:hypothetical protein
MVSVSFLTFAVFRIIPGDTAVVAPVATTV